MARRNEHLIVIMLEPMPIDTDFEIWPPHITIVPWFHCDDPARLDRLLAGIATNTPQFMAKAGKKETWGVKQKFEVARIDDAADLVLLHKTVFETLETNEFRVHQKDFLNTQYQPHVALRNHLQKGWDYQTGQEILVDRFSLVSQVRLKKSGRMIKRIIREYGLA